jgi:hypothetical protein
VNKRQECRCSLLEAALVLAVQLLVQRLQLCEIHGSEGFLRTLREIQELFERLNSSHPVALGAASAFTPLLAFGNSFGTAFNTALGE